jgi:hypothetical protein
MWSKTQQNHQSGQSCGCSSVYLLCGPKKNCHVSSLNFQPKVTNLFVTGLRDCSTLK